MRREARLAFASTLTSTAAAATCLCAILFTSFTWLLMACIWFIVQAACAACIHKNARMHAPAALGESRALILTAVLLIACIVQFWLQIMVSGDTGLLDIGRVDGITLVGWASMVSGLQRAISFLSKHLARVSGLYGAVMCFHPLSQTEARMVRLLWC